MAAGRAHMYDLSVPQARMYEAVEAVRGRLRAFGPDVVTIGFGHFGDGNLHLLVADGRPARDDVRSHSFSSAFSVYFIL